MLKSNFLSIGRTVTPENITCAALPKQPLIHPQEETSQQKRLFPLNFKHFKTQAVRKGEKSPPPVPEFISEYMQQPNPYCVRRKSSFQPANLSFRTRRSPSPAFLSEERVPSTTEVPVLSYKDFQRPLPRPAPPQYYKPQVVHVSRRSKITLYSSFTTSAKPIRSRPAKSVSKPSVRHPSLLKPHRVTRPENASAMYSSEPIVDIPAMSFGEKLLRINELVVQPALQQEDSLIN